MGVGVWWNGREMAGKIHAARPTLRTTDNTYQDIYYVAAYLGASTTRPNSQEGMSI